MFGCFMLLVGFLWEIGWIIKDKLYDSLLVLLMIVLVFSFVMETLGLVLKKEIFLMEILMEIVVFVGFLLENALGSVLDIH